MFVVISIMLLGIGAGWLLRSRPISGVIGRSIMVAIFLLLFLLGVSVGTNRQIMENISTLGLEALLIGGAATLGSVCCAWGVWRLFFRKGEEHEG